ncbi:fasciclin-1 isoform X1 [Photinus pyralis]|uniref:fasciclin-1 isoform X1 n=1 Tax=Photinus pyralis TaxID=7054 RepID=UPI0012671641|nr:fasciclin-1 isoform X1 [Photinus pyralis]
MVKNNPEAKFTLEYKSVTVFAPINAAFQKYPKPIDESQFYLTLYHMGSLAKTTDQLATMTHINTELEGHPPLWITTKSDPNGNELYVNNAKILQDLSNIKAKNNGKEQVVHKIDEVLVPTTSPRTLASGLAKPNALDFLSQFETLDINPYRVRNFRQRVQQLQKQDVFRNMGTHTFFIPIDEGILHSDLIDNKTIDGHLIPKKVLFTAPTHRDIAFETTANGDNLKVYITFFQEPNDKTEAVYIKSETRVGDARHSPGVVISEIVKPNIPVENGVIHLIQKPLMVVDTTVNQFLQFKEKGEGPLSRFVEAIADTGDLGKDFLRTIERARTITLFAPSNAAWNRGTIKSVLGSPERMQEILYLHLVVDERLTKDQIMKNNKRQFKVYQAPTMNAGKNLYFNVATSGDDSVLTVEGGGVNATVIQANIAATNGIIHIIDRVLGVPYTTVYDKLQQDPMLNETFHLGSFGDFNAQLNNTKKKFTFFVPRDKAWADARLIQPSTVKKLFMRELGYYAQQILQRHLVESEVPYTMERLVKLTTNKTNSATRVPRKEVELQSLRSTLRISVEERQNHTYVIHWKGNRIPVFRPNVECTNGIIHVIDAPFLQEDDIRVIRDSGVGIFLSSNLLMVLLVKWLFL